MANPKNRITVVYPNGQVRTRRVQSTVCPNKTDIGYISDINMWFLHLRVVTDLQYKATAAIDIIVATDMLLEEAQQIINGPPDYPAQ